MMFVGLTGGMGSGKTTVGEIFVELGIPVYNSDQQAKFVMETSLEIRNAIKNLFGEEAYKDQRLNKNFISEQVFHNKSLLDALNSIVHPTVRKHFIAWAKEQNTAYVIQEAAIIFEIGSENFYDAIILVTAPKKIRIERIRRRDPEVSEKQIRARIKNQWTDSRKISASSFIVENIELKKTRPQVLMIHSALQKKGTIRKI